METLGYGNATSFMVMDRRENMPFFKINSSVHRFPIWGVNDWLRRRSTVSRKEGGRIQSVGLGDLTNLTGRQLAYTAQDPIAE